MYNKAFFTDKYLAFKKAHDGQIPKRRDFEKFAGAPKYALEKAFGSDCFSKLQAECGDIANKLNLIRTSEAEIFEQWGLLAKKHSRIPTQADWFEAGYKPSPSGLSKAPHNLKWSEIPQKFAEYAQGKENWTSVLLLINQSQPVQSSGKARKDDFDKLSDVILTWAPDRKRNAEEGYKIELRNFLSQSGYKVKEEAGETRSDLLVDEKFSIELKKDPSQSEYDRLLGQMVRHGLSFGAVIAVVLDASSADRFEKFSQAADAVFPKMGIDAKVLRK